MRKIISNFDEITPRRCRHCGQRARDLAAVRTPRGWRELCIFCRERYDFASALLPNVRVPGRSPGSDGSNGAA